MEDVFEQLVKEAMLHDPIHRNVYETENPPGEDRTPPYWFLEYEAQQVQDRVDLNFRT